MTEVVFNDAGGKEKENKSWMSHLEIQPADLGA
jgi:hypothetical protein